MWTWFNQCSQESFVNCFFRTEGPCKNPKHNTNINEMKKETRTVFDDEFDIED